MGIIISWLTPQWECPQAYLYIPNGVDFEGKGFLYFANFESLFKNQCTEMHYTCQDKDLQCPISSSGFYVVECVKDQKEFNYYFCRQNNKNKKTKTQSIKPTNGFSNLLIQNIKKNFIQPFKNLPDSIRKSFICEFIQELENLKEAKKDTEFLQSLQKSTEFKLQTSSQQLFDDLSNFMVIFHEENQMNSQQQQIKFCKFNNYGIFQYNINGHNQQDQEINKNIHFLLNTADIYFFFCDCTDEFYCKLKKVIQYNQKKCREFKIFINFRNSSCNENQLKKHFSGIQEKKIDAIKFYVDEIKGSKNAQIRFFFEKGPSALVNIFGMFYYQANNSKLNNQHEQVQKSIQIAQQSQIYQFYGQFGMCLGDKFLLKDYDEKFIGQGIIEQHFDEQHFDEQSFRQNVKYYILLVKLKNDQYLVDSKIVRNIEFQSPPCLVVRIKSNNQEEKSYGKYLYDHMANLGEVECFDKDGKIKIKNHQGQF